MNDQKFGEALFWLYLSVFPKDINVWAWVDQEKDP